MSDDALVVSEITAGYGKTLILRSVSLRLGVGEIVCIAGPNGAGKSTLLKAVAGIVPWVAGSVTIFGQPAENGQTTDAARRVLGIVPQVNNVFPSLTVLENLLVVMPGAWSRRQRKDALERVFHAIPAVRDIRGAMGSSLSGGQRQSVAFAMALVRDPKLLLLDEPSAALSPIAAREVFDRITALRETGIPILLVEQNVKSAMAISDRAYFLESGKNFMDGRTEVIRDDPRIRKAYLGA